MYVIMDVFGLLHSGWGGVGQETCVPHLITQVRFAIIPKFQTTYINEVILFLTLFYLGGGGGGGGDI